MIGNRKIFGLVNSVTGTISRHIVIATCLFAAVDIIIASSAKADLGDTTSASSYAEQISLNYDFKFGPNPFAPGNATTTTGTFIPGDMFVSSKRCGQCHTDAHAEWQQSA